MTRKIFCALLIIFGAALDSYFYIFRFRADGTALPIAIMAALALELLLAFAVWNAQKSKVFAGVAVVITLYAVVQTSAGQTFSLLSRDATAGDTSSTVSALMAEEQKNLDRLDMEYRTITSQLSSIKTAEERADYAGTVYRATLRLSELNKERNATADKLAILAEKNGNSEIAKVRKMSIYDFYASMPAWSGMDWLKFVFHTILSILIAVMTPIGILTWNAKKSKADPIDVIRKKRTRRARAEQTPEVPAVNSGMTVDDIDIFVSRSWRKVCTGADDKIMSEFAFYDWCKRDGVITTPGAYAEGFKRALSLGIIKRDGSAIIKDTALIKRKLQQGAPYGKAI